MLLNFFLISNEKGTYSHDSKLNSNPYHYKLKFILPSKQMYDSKFHEFKTVQTHKMRKKDQIWKVAFFFLSSFFVDFS